ncbi:MAG: FtsQ-type POTRA domain-containing protein [Anaerolineales bacterium]|nr:FtsQ-type POTRA domain-containing protein [Anaerolineales bacterium]
MADKQQRKRLRKQPKMRRIHSSATMHMPKVSTKPKTARTRKRKRRTESLKRSLNLVRRFVFNARWLSLALLAATIYALYLIAQADEYYLTYIPVEGTLTVPPEEVIAASKLAGSHIFAADPVSAAEAITEIPGVISSTVTLQFPNQVAIRIGEESPIAVWQEGGQDYWITKNGRLVPSRSATAGMVRIISEMDGKLDLETAVVEEPLAEEGAELTTEETTETAVVTPIPTPKPFPTRVLHTDAGDKLPTSLAYVPAEVLEGALNLHQLRPEISELYYRPFGGLSYLDDRGWRVYFGTGTDMHQKLVLYDDIVAHLLNQGIQPVYISVSNQENPFYKSRY